MHRLVNKYITCCAADEKSSATLRHVIACLGRVSAMAHHGDRSARVIPNLGAKEPPKRHSSHPIGPPAEKSSVLC